MNMDASVSLSRVRYRTFQSPRGFYWPLSSDDALTAQAVQRDAGIKRANYKLVPETLNTLGVMAELSESLEPPAARSRRATGTFRNL